MSEGQPAPRGRQRMYATNAARQHAYRQKKKALNFVTIFPEFHHANTVTKRAKKRVTKLGRPRRYLTRAAQQQAYRKRHKPKAAHVAYNQGEQEWYTPPAYLEAARAVLGAIDLDPASSEAANQVVQAASYYTCVTNGLLHPWAGRVWLNPPYAAALVGQFTQKLVHHLRAGDVSEAIVLVNNATETAWFQDLVAVCQAICLPHGRVRFLDATGKPGAPLQGQAILYSGPAVAHFARIFQDFGSIARLEGI